MEKFKGSGKQALETQVGVSSENACWPPNPSVARPPRRKDLAALRARGFLRWLSGEESACHAGDMTDAGLITGQERSPGGGHGTPLQCSRLENSMDRATWRTTVHGSQRIGHN